MRYGLPGYGLYFACIELIADKLCAEKPSFELEEDAELLAHAFQYDQLKLQDMMAYMVELGLFKMNPATKRIVCEKLAERLDNTKIRNPELKKISTAHKKAITEQRHKHGDKVLLTDIEYTRLCEEFGAEVIKRYIQNMNDHCVTHNKHYADYNRAIRTWIRRDKEKDTFKGATKGVKGLNTCPECGKQIPGTSCRCGWFKP